MSDNRIDALMGLVEMLCIDMIDYFGWEQSQGMRRQLKEVAVDVVRGQTTTHPLYSDAQCYYHTTMLRIVREDAVQVGCD
jgi:hypothetical protein